MSGMQEVELVFLSGVPGSVPSPLPYAAWGSVEPPPQTDEWFSRKDYDGKDVIIIIAARIIFGAALTAKREK